MNKTIREEVIRYYECDTQDNFIKAITSDRIKVSFPDNSDGWGSIDGKTAFLLEFKSEKCGSNTYTNRMMILTQMFAYVHNRSMFKMYDDFKFVLVTGKYVSIVKFKEVKTLYEKFCKYYSGEMPSKTWNSLYLYKEIANKTDIRFVEFNIDKHSVKDVVNILLNE